MTVCRLLCYIFKSIELKNIDCLLKNVKGL